MSARSSHESSVVIVGAGPVGLTVAALLATGPAAARMTVRVLDAQDAAQWNGAATDLRVYALSRASQRSFEQLGLWETICARRASPYRRMRVWEGEDLTGPAAVEFDSAEIGEPDLGHIVEDNLLREQLTRVLAASGRVDLSFATELESVAPTAAGMRVTVKSGESSAATLVVAADGGASRVRSLLGMPVVERSYGQHAIVTHVVSAAAHEATALQRFLPGGPLAFLPLADGRSSVVWSLPSERAAALLRSADDEFVAELQEASAGALGRLGPIAPRAAFPLTMLHALAYCRPGVVLAGDAAHCVHPLAGQGMNLGLEDAVCLAQTLTTAALAGEHIGDERVLGRYARARKRANLEMLLAFDALDRLFRLPAWAAPLRKLGLSAVDRLTPAKRLLMRRALGLAASRRGEQYAAIHGHRH